MGLVIEDPVTEDQTELDASFVIRDLSLDSPDSVQRAALAHGGKDLSGGFFDPRRVILSGYVYGDNRSAHQLMLDALAIDLNKPDLKLYPDSVLDRYLVLHRLVSVKQRFEQGIEFRVSSVDFEFVCEDPFWQDVNLVDTSLTSIGPNGAMGFQNNGSMDSNLIVEFRPVGTGTQISIKNTADANRRFVYTDFAMSSSTTITVNGVTGEIQRGTLNTARFISGSFLRAVTGANTLVYEGPTGTAIAMRAYFRPRYL